MVKIDEIWPILTTFSEEAIAAALGKCEELGFDKTRGEISLEESLINLKNMKALLEDAIQSKKLIQIPLSIQNSIHGELTAISKALVSLAGGVDEVVNLSSSIERLFTLTWQSRLQDLSGQTAVYKDTENRLKNLEIQAQRVVNELTQALDLRDKLQNLVTQLEEAQTNFATQYTLIKQNADESTKVKTDIDTLGGAATNTVTQIETDRDKVSKLLSSIEAVKTQVDLRDGEIKEYKDSVAEINTKADDLVSRLNKELKNTFETRDDMVEKLNQVHDRAESLLPGTTSAGLAHAFRQRKEDIAKTKKLWFIYFAASILSLVGFVILIVLEYPSGTATQTNADWWQHVLQRTPLTFPFIWAGWFFGRNFGHMIRLEEVYAFKETVSRSFEGYKTQMSEVSADKGLPYLCEEAIKILSASPLSIFERQTSDETPVNSWWDRVFSRKPQKE
ncbi:MAG: hypothetical protein AB1772_00965 [Candidatus Zixiibacteriota bacterium]